MPPVRDGFPKDAAELDAAVPVINVQNAGIGDVVVACWVVCSAEAAGRRVRLNAGGRGEVARLLGMSDAHLTSAAPDWPGLQLEYQLAAGTTPLSRFDAWCRSLGLPALTPVRPAYDERSADAEWAREQWRTVSRDEDRPRVLLFPEAAWSVRVWPKAYFIDLAAELQRDGMAVAAMAGTTGAVDFMPCHWWGGFTVRQAAAMCRQAAVVVANDSGPAHLASALEVRTVAICGPTDPRILFAHEPNVQAISIEASELPCVGCHFSDASGYRMACSAGGCQALMRLPPSDVGATVRRIGEDCVSRNGTECGPQRHRDTEALKVKLLIS